MYINIIKDLLIKNLSIHKVYVSMNNGCYTILVIDQLFMDMSQLERHQFIYTPLTQYIVNNKIHAISIYAFTPSEWKLQYTSYIDFVNPVNNIDLYNE